MVVPNAAIGHADAVTLEQDTTGTGPGAPPGNTSGAIALAAGGFVPEPGDPIGRYIVRDHVAEGGMGLIVTAEDPELGRVVAIKLLHPDLTGAAHEQQQRLQREAQAMAKVSHANLVTVFDVGTHEGQVFVAMEYVVGVTLRQWLGPKRDWRDIVEMFCSAGRGLAAAHKAGLVHRDFKPANVLVGDDGVPQVLDFGLVRRAGEVDEIPDPDDDDEPLPREDTLAIDLTRTGSVMGTPAYMAPEQHLGQPTDARSDQFAFCVALYEALYDERPFPGQDAGRVTMAVLENERRPKPESTEVPDEVYRVLDRGLSREPEDRYPSMEPLLEALGEQVLRARAPAPAQPEPTRRWPLVVGAIAVLIAGGAAVMAISGNDDGGDDGVEAVDAATPAALESPADHSTRPAEPNAPDPTPEPGSAEAKGGGGGGDRPTPAADPGTALPGLDEDPVPLPEVEAEPLPAPEGEGGADEETPPSGEHAPPPSEPDAKPAGDEPEPSAPAEPSE
jgi:serine/threonine protein kinase